MGTEYGINIPNAHTGDFGRFRDGDGYAVIRGQWRLPETQETSSFADFARSKKFEKNLRNRPQGT